MTPSKIYWKSLHPIILYKTNAFYYTIFSITANIFQTVKSVLQMKWRLSENHLNFSFHLKMLASWQKHKQEFNSSEKKSVKFLERRSGWLLQFKTKTGEKYIGRNSSESRLCSTYFGLKKVSAWEVIFGAKFGQGALNSDEKNLRSIFEMFSETKIQQEERASVCTVVLWYLLCSRSLLLCQMDQTKNCHYIWRNANTVLLCYSDPSYSVLPLIKAN